MNFAERMMVALASATYSGDSMAWKRGIVGDLNSVFRIRWQSASEQDRVVRGVAEAYGDDVPYAVAGLIAVECNVSDRDGVVTLGELRISSNRPEWMGAIGDVIILKSLGEAAVGNIFGEAN
jgi:hypothetical protein